MTSLRQSCARSTGLNSCGSGTTVTLLKMALLNEGIRLAADLPRKESPASVGLNFVAQNGNRL